MGVVVNDVGKDDGVAESMRKVKTAADGMGKRMVDTEEGVLGGEIN